MTDFGETLRMAREAKGLTIAEISDATHMLPQQIEDLENENFSRIAAPIYGRGFVKLYCGAVGIDPKPLVAEFMDIYNGNKQPTIKMRKSIRHQEPVAAPRAAPEPVPLHSASPAEQPAAPVAPVAPPPVAPVAPPVAPPPAEQPVAPIAAPEAAPAERVETARVQELQFDFGQSAAPDMTSAHSLEAETEEVDFSSIATPADEPAPGAGPSPFVYAASEPATGATQVPPPADGFIEKLMRLRGEAAPADAAPAEDAPSRDEPSQACDSVFGGLTAAEEMKRAVEKTPFRLEPKTAPAQQPFVSGGGAQTSRYGSPLAVKPDKFYSDFYIPPAFWRVLILVAGVGLAIWLCFALGAKIWRAATTAPAELAEEALPGAPQDAAQTAPAERNGAGDGADARRAQRTPIKLPPLYSE